MTENFIKCLNPRFIKNKYTGEVIFSECGRCEHCMLKKSAVRTMLCKLESSVHRYCYFVTLTFANQFMPVARLVATNELLDNYDVIRESDGLVLGNVHFPSHLDKMMLIKKCGFNNNQVPILDYSYVQKFLKRLRKYLKKFTNEKIRYFVCGEYGPVHFRPHFHLLLWFDEEQASSHILQGIRSCWSFGRVDASLSAGKSSSYVASYVNSNQYLPGVFRFSSTKPLSYHSRYFGEQFYASEIQVPSEIEFGDIVKKRICFNGFNSDVFLWRSLKDRLFPKLKGFASQSKHERVLSYSAYAVIRDWTKEVKPINQARFITDYVRYVDFYHPDDRINDLLQLFRYGLNYYDGDSYIIPSLVDYDKFERMVYMMILRSRRFLIRNCRCDDSYHNVERQVRHIEEFYKYLDSLAVNNQLKEEEALSEKNIQAKYLFHNTLLLDDYKESIVYNTHKSNLLLKFDKFTKHKKLNDLNKIFVY